MLFSMFKPSHHYFKVVNHFIRGHPEDTGAFYPQEAPLWFLNDHLIYKIVFHYSVIRVVRGN